MIRRIGGLISRPAEEFAEIVRKPTFLAPTVLTTALVVGLLFFAVQRIGSARLFGNAAKALETQPELAGQPREIIAEALAIVVEGFALLAVPIAIPLTALSLLPLVWGLGGTAKFRPMLGAVAWAGLPPALGGFLTGAAVLILRDPAHLSFESLMPFNLGILVPGKLVHTFAGTIEAFSLWSLVLLAYGAAAASGLSFRKCLLSIAPPVFIFIWILIAIAAMVG